VVGEAEADDGSLDVSLDVSLDDLAGLVVGSREAGVGLSLGQAPVRVMDVARTLRATLL
jgi:hypothetical protein